MENEKDNAWLYYGWWHRNVEPTLKRFNSQMYMEFEYWAIKAYTKGEQSRVQIYS